MPHAGSGGAGAPVVSPWMGLASRSVTAKAPPTAAANGAGQTPAFPGQTRAPAPATLSKIKVQTITDDLDAPWGVEALRDGRFVVTQKGGALRVVNTKAEVLDPIAGVPAVASSGQGGLLDVAIDQATEPMTLCITYSQPRDGGENSTAASCTTATGADNLTIAPLQMVFQQEPAWQSAQHFGSRFVFSPDGLVYITTGERSVASARVLSQDKTATLGKVVRLKRDGSSPTDNPFAADGGPAAQVWSYGHRNLQAAALDPQNRLWTVEHGPRGGDELNRPEAGKNYGWPIITYGIDYSGEPIGDGITQMNGMEQPIYFWDPVIAPSGMLIYSGDLFSEWKGDVLVGGLVAQALVHLKLQDDRVVSEERFELGGRVRDVTQGPDGAIYVLLEGGNGQLLRLTPELAAGP
jgi:aldose sugar dehydrogenase